MNAAREAKIKSPLLKFRATRATTLSIVETTKPPLPFTMRR